MTSKDVFITRSDGVGHSGVQDQYADGKAAQVWEKFVSGAGGSKRSTHNSDFLVDLFRNKSCHRILDVACGTGVDSVMLLEAGFNVMSVDASDKMLKHACKKRWDRRREPAFDNWVIEEANWLTLPEDLKETLSTDGKFDALICLGNSFAHLVELSGDQSKQRLALRNFEHCLKPGGILVIDHRNFDAILDSSSVAKESIYYNELAAMTPYILYSAGKPVILTLEYKMENGQDGSDFRLSYYPHRLADFTAMLDTAFPNAQHTVLADFKSVDKINNPGFYIHVVEKSLGY